MAHIQHLIEDREITLGTIQAIAEAAANGTLADATEKLDGVNIVFTCTPRYEARFARSESDIRTGGMIHAVLEAKFTGRGLVQEAFSKGSAAIASALRSLAPLEVRTAFDDGKLWYSAEIIYTKNPNVVQYENDSVVFHERPVLRLHGDEVIRELNPPFHYIHGNVLDMNAVARMVGWRVHGPQRVTLTPMHDTSTLENLQKALEATGRDTVTLRGALRESARKQLSALNVSGSTLDAAVERLVESPGCPSLTTLKPKLPQSAIALLRDSDEWASRELGHLDRCISRFASAVLRDVPSALIDDNVSEARRIDARLNRSVKLVKESHIPEALAVLEKHAPKLEPITTPVEGIVFPWGDKLYKLTGAFAPANAIMGLCKYGRGKAVPPLERM